MNALTPSDESRTPCSNQIDSLASRVDKIAINKPRSPKPKAGAPYDVSLQTIIADSTLVHRKQTALPKKENGREGATQRKRIVRPSDGNKKLTKCKKSVQTLNAQESVQTVEDPGQDGETPAVERVKERCSVEAYCKLLADMDLADSKEVDTLAAEMISGLKFFQDRLHHKDELKSRCRRRMYFGIKEAIKYIQGKRISMVILAKDLHSGPGGLDDLVRDLFEKAKFHRVPIVCALTRNKLKSLTHKPSRISCLAITDPSGKDEQFQQILAKLKPQKYFAEPPVEPTMNESERQEHLKNWTSTTRRGRFEFLVDRLF